MNTEVGIHLEGEEDFFEFPTYGGKVYLHPTDDAMTPFGGLVPWSAFQKKSGIIDELSRSCPVLRSSPNARSVYDIICSFVLTALCDGKRFSHVNRLREDPSLKELFALDDGVVSDDTIRRFFYSIEEADGRRWVAGASRRLWSSLPEKFVLDWDSTVQTKYGSQEGAELGYNPQKRGRRSFHPLIAAVGSTRLCLYYRWRPGDSATSGEWTDAMEECLEWLGQFKSKLWLNRGDIGFANDRIMSWHEETDGRPKYLFKLKLTRNVRRAMASVMEEEWTGKNSGGVLQVAEKMIQLDGWNKPRRVVLARRLLGVVPAAENNSFWDEVKYEYEAYVTNLGHDEADAWQVIELYRKRADCENIFDELKNHWGFNGFCCKKSAPTGLAARLLLLTYNMWNLFLRLMKPEKHVEAFQGRRWFLLIAARLVKTSRRKELHIAVQGQWWQELKEGYERICRWLNITAPQLEIDSGLQPILL